MQMNATVAVLALGLGACAGSPSATTTEPANEPTTTGPASPATPSTSTAVTARGLFCAYGGVGIVPNPLPPGYDTTLASMAFEIDNPGPPISGVTLRAATLVDSSGAALATMTHPVHFVVLPPLPAPGPTLGSFGVYLNPEGAPFSGTLPTGRTQLRVRYAIDRDPGSFPDHCRLELGGFGAAPLVVEGALDGAWPTS